MRKIKLIVMGLFVVVMDAARCCKVRKFTESDLRFWGSTTTVSGMQGASLTKTKNNDELIQLVGCSGPGFPALIKRLKEDATDLIEAVIPLEQITGAGSDVPPSVYAQLEIINGLLGGIRDTLNRVKDIRASIQPGVDVTTGVGNVGNLLGDGGV